VLQRLLRAEEFRTRSSSATARPRCASSPPASSARASRSARSTGDMDQPSRIAEFDRFKTATSHPGRIRRRARGLDVKGRQPRHQLRRSLAAGRLHPPHRPHRPRRRQGHRHHACDPRGRRSSAADREATGTRSRGQAVPKSAERRRARPRERPERRKRAKPDNACEPEKPVDANPAPASRRAGGTTPSRQLTVARGRGHAEEWNGPLPVPVAQRGVVTPCCGKHRGAFLAPSRHKTGMLR
jgi:hypothetical protein